MSVTRPTLIDFLAGAAVVDVAAALPVEVDELLSDPQPAAAMRMPAMPMAAMARRVERARTCERTPSGIERDC